MGQEQSQQGGTEDTKSDTATTKPNSVKLRSSSVRQKAKLEDIIVVKDTPDSGCKELDETIKKLKELKITYPIIKNVGGVPSEGIDILPGLNSDPITEMILRYQYHLTECAEAVAFDQNAIAKRVKEIDSYSMSVLKDANERQKQMDGFLVNMKKFTEIDSLIDRVNKNMDKTVTLLLNVNQMLPEKDQLSQDDLDMFMKQDLSIN